MMGLKVSDEELRTKEIIWRLRDVDSLNFRKRKGSTIVSFDAKTKCAGTSDASVLSIDAFHSTMRHGKIC